MRMFLKEEIRRMEAAAAEQGVSMEALMENAGRALAEEAALRLRPLRGKFAAILCGKGNNGGDGFVCARYLQEQGVHCTVILAQGLPHTQLAATAFDRLPETVTVVDASASRREAEEALSRADVLFDCVFGFSFRGELPEDVAELLAFAGTQRGLKLAADLPSGAECDTGRAGPETFRADVTVAFTGAKPAHASYPAKAYCGDVVIRPVGVPRELTEMGGARCFETDAPRAALPLKQPDAQANKGDMGKLLLVCGSEGMAGACIMAARAALRSGAGLVRVAIPKNLYPIVAPALPECIFTLYDPFSPEEPLREALGWATACLAGCGLGNLADRVCPILLTHCHVPLVLDADGLNFLARNPEALERVQAPLVLTPHPGEMARLCQDAIAEIQADRLGAALEKARETGAVVALKGAATVIADPEGVCGINPTGNPGMAKGGSGDVLAGIIASLLAQGIAPFDAAVTGAYVHGLAGDLCAKRLGERAMLPTDLIEALPAAYRRLTAAR